MLDDDLFLSDLTIWDYEKAIDIAKSIDIELTQIHFDMIEVIRSFYTEYGRFPKRRVIVKLFEKNNLPHSTEYLTSLFPRGVSGSLALISGLPKPSDCT